MIDISKVATFLLNISEQAYRLLVMNRMYVKDDIKVKYKITLPLPSYTVVARLSTRFQISAGLN